MRDIIRPGQLTRREWAKRLNEQWDNIQRATVEAIVQLGRDLKLAKEQLGEHGKWLDFVENDLKLDRSLSVMFMRIATWLDIEYSGPARNMIKQLPPDYTTIYKITRLDEATFASLLKDGTICPTLKRNEVSKILRFDRVTADEQRVLNLVPVVGKYRTIVLDPAWDYVWLSLAGRAKPG